MTTTARKRKPVRTEKRTGAGGVSGGKEKLSVAFQRQGHRVHRSFQPCGLVGKESSAELIAAVEMIGTPPCSWKPTSFRSCSVFQKKPRFWAPPGKSSPRKSSRSPKSSVPHRHGKRRDHKAARHSVDIPPCMTWPPGSEIFWTALSERRGRLE